MNIIEAEAARAAGWAGQHFRLPHHHDQDQLQPQEQTMPTTVSQQVDVIERELARLSANKLIAALARGGVGATLADHDADLLVAMAKSLEGKPTPPSFTPAPTPAGQAQPQQPA